jgi:hypothetical protein
VPDDGADTSTVEDAFTDVFLFDADDYADPTAGYTYEAALDRRAVEWIEGRGFKVVEGRRSPTEFILRFTGDGRLELSASSKPTSSAPARRGGSGGRRPRGR